MREIPGSGQGSRRAGRPAPRISKSCDGTMILSTPSFGEIKCPPTKTKRSEGASLSRSIAAGRRGILPRRKLPEYLTTKASPRFHPFRYEFSARRRFLLALARMPLSFRPLFLGTAIAVKEGICQRKDYEAGSADDVVDDSNERRGFFSVNALWKNKIAVLVGDYFLSKGLLLALDTKNYNLLHIVSTAVKRMSEGELLQMEKARRLDIDESIYFEIIKNKTASLIAALRMRSISALADASSSHPLTSPTGCNWPGWRAPHSAVVMP